MRNRNVARTLLLSICITAPLAVAAGNAAAQVFPVPATARDEARHFVRPIDRLPAAFSNRQTDPQSSARGTGFFTSTRQALLIGGVAASMAAYAYFLLQFNNRRGASDDAQKAYEEDVRQHAQSYVDQGIQLDEIQTYRDWQKAFNDARSSREWAARAGLMAVLIGFFGILDAATSHDSAALQSTGLTVHPTLGFVPLRNDVLVGAKLKF